MWLVRDQPHYPANDTSPLLPIILLIQKQEASIHKLLLDSEVFLLDFLIIKENQ
ncbi:hypothetical protein [Zooshikella harenae]|uniref:Uncharacterized protein n=1 Tax=Zooshikella harenae TaxID=2827238 RepID=A0ABS5ZJN5_9GAMM|nr:hypothetical protein [Zooshikella harenae]MBU2714179.1 hypothetical protein [Zooshikella harenae]